MLDFNLDLGIPRIGFVSLMKVNVYCSEHYIDLEYIHLANIPHVYFTKINEQGNWLQVFQLSLQQESEDFEIYMRNYANQNYMVTL